jgi:LacI family transcriptional regulator
MKIPKVILLLETSRAYGRGLLRGIANYSKIHGPWIFYREPRGLKSSVPQLADWKADGIIMRNSIISPQLLKLNIPSILVRHETKQIANLPEVVPDSKEITKLAAEHLIDRGFRQFAYCGFDEIHWSNDRKDYFNKIIEEAGYKIFNYAKSNSKKYSSWEKELKYIAEWLKTLPKPIGIMACNDDRGHHVLEACKIAGLRVPEDIAVIGVDNDSLMCDLCDPPLTSVALNSVTAGYQCAELLHRLMKGEPMQGQEIIVKPTHVFKRQSTDILAISDINVTNAIRYIRQNAKNKIRVDDIVAQTSLNRRSLEMHFRKTMNRSILFSEV